MFKYKICKNGMATRMIKRVAKPFVFGMVFFLVDLTVLNFLGEKHSKIVLSMIVLGSMGVFYIFLLRWIFGNTYFYHKVAMRAIDVCIVKSRSVDYGDIIYYPYILYEYTINGKKHTSDRVCLDERSCYVTVWYDNKNENKGLGFAENKIDEILQNKVAYSLKLVPAISYLSITLEKRRKNYFAIMMVVSCIMILAGFYFL